MDKNKKKSIRISIYTFIFSFIILNICFYIKHGANYLYVDDLIYGIPLWTILLTYSVYGSSVYYYKQKNIYIPVGYESDIKRKIEWNMYRMFMLSKFMRILMLMFGMAFPVYLLAYLDQSKELHSSPIKIVFLFIFTVIFGIGSEFLKRKYMKHIQSHE